MNHNVTIPVFKVDEAVLALVLESAKHEGGFSAEDEIELGGPIQECLAGFEYFLR